MKPVLTDGRLTVELNQRERDTLARARDIGVLLDQMHQTTGAALIAAVDAVLCEKGTIEQ